MQIGIDIGGSHIAVGIVSQNGKIVGKREKDLDFIIPTIEQETNTKQKIRDIIISLIHDVLKDAGAPMCLLTNIGIASPGKVENGIIKDIYNLGIKEFNLKEELENYYQIPVEVRNDAKCAGLAEKQYGALKEYDDAVFLCLGTGIGGATFIGGKMLEPTRAAGSEYGHMIIQKDGIECKCGNKGCWEKYAAMSAFKKKIIEILNLREDLDSKQILQELRENREKIEIQKYIEEYLEYVILGISNIVNIIEPQAICLGGGFVYYKDILYIELLKKIEENKYKFNIPKIILASQGNDAGMLGAVL